MDRDGVQPERSVVKSYRDLIVWQKGIDLAKSIYLLTSSFPQAEMYGLTNQMRRAAISIPSNIAEGQARQHTGEFAHFLYIALGSLAEIDTQLALACELGYTGSGEVNQNQDKIIEIRKMLHTLIRKLPEAPMGRKSSPLR